MVQSKERITYHLMCADSYLLNITIAKEIFTNLSGDHFFLLYYRNGENKERFVKFFKSIRFYNYSFYYKNTLQDMLYAILFSFITRDVRRIKQVISNPLVGLLRHYEYDNILIHGEIPPSNVLLRLILNNKKLKFGWVCWGSLPRKRNSIVEFFIGRDYFYRFIRKASLIIALTDPDRLKIESLSGETANTTFVSYMLGDVMDYGVCNQTENILIGNSGSYIGSYMYLADKLKFLQKCHLYFMLNYSVSQNDSRLAELEVKCTEYYPNRFTLWTDVVSKSDYIEYLRNMKVYICAAERQTGLGAIECCANLGIKLYLNGVNYRHCEGLGLIVHHINELKDTSEEEILRFERNDQLHNKHVYFDKYSYTTLVPKWNNALDKLHNNYSFSI